MAKVDKAIISPDKHLAFIQVVPSTDPESDATYALVKRVRAAERAGGAAVNVGGASAQDHDFTDLISGSLWKIAVFVMIFSYIVLLFVLRSVLLPLKAVVMNLLSVGAAYGVLVIVFQWGWVDSVIGFDHLGYVNALTPPLLLAIVFGLSMDYEVFLLTPDQGALRRAPATTAPPSPAAWRDRAKTITSAALIMVAVFAIFALTGLPQVKQIGVGLAVAIFLDATLVRLVLVPGHDGAAGRRGTGGCRTGWTGSCPTWTSRAAPSRWSSTPTPSRRSSPPSLRVRPLEVATWPDFARLVERHNGVWGGCWCMDGLRAPPDWRITCFFVDRRHRRSGVASTALAGALHEIARLGGGTVESYPEDSEGRSVSASFLHNGTVAMFERHGFERTRRLGKHHWVVSRVVR